MIYSLQRNEILPHHFSNADHDGMDVLSCIYITTHVSKTFELIEDARDVRSNRGIAWLWCIPRRGKTIVNRSSRQAIYWLFATIVATIVH